MAHVGLFEMFQDDLSCRKFLTDNILAATHRPNQAAGGRERRRPELAPSCHRQAKAAATPTRTHSERYEQNQRFGGLGRNRQSPEVRRELAYRREKLPPLVRLLSQASGAKARQSWA